MKEIKIEELKEILENHRKWLDNEKGGKRANLSNANLNNANLRSANLRSANLSNANLRSANLSNANLSNADLNNANLNNANLRSANLSNADLNNADLNNADLNNADLNNADLNNANGNMKEIKSINVETYAIVYTDKVIQIGCECHDIKDWFEFNDRRILEMDGKKALNFWYKWKPILQQLIKP